MINELYTENGNLTGAQVEALDIFELDKIDAAAATEEEEGYIYGEEGEEAGDGDQGEYYDF